MPAVWYGRGNRGGAEVEEKGRIRPVNGNTKAFSSPNKHVSVRIVQ